MRGRASRPKYLILRGPQETGHNNLFLLEVLINKYIGFDIDSKKIVACVVESEKKIFTRTHPKTPKKCRL